MRGMGGAGRGEGCHMHHPLAPSMARSQRVDQPLPDLPIHPSIQPSPQEPQAMPCTGGTAIALFSAATNNTPVEAAAQSAASRIMMVLLRGHLRRQCRAVAGADRASGMPDGIWRLAGENAVADRRQRGPGGAQQQRLVGQKACGAAVTQCRLLKPRAKNTKWSPSRRHGGGR